MAYYNNNYYDKNNPKLRLMLLGGIPNIDTIGYWDIHYDQDYLILDRLKLKVFGKESIINTYKISREKFIAIDVISNETIKQKEKSVIARGIVGGLVFGPAGLILGGMSGIGNNTTVQRSSVLCIAYFGKDENDIKNIVFGVECFELVCRVFVNDFMNTMQQPEIEELNTNEAGEYLL